MSHEQKTRDLLQLALKFGAHKTSCGKELFDAACDCGFELWKSHIEDELHDRSEKHHREHRKQLLRKRF